MTATVPPALHLEKRQAHGWTVVKADSDLAVLQFIGSKRKAITWLNALYATDIDWDLPTFDLRSNPAAMRLIGEMQMQICAQP
jgi:hypothetical protein